MSLRSGPSKIQPLASGQMDKSQEGGWRLGWAVDGGGGDQ
jgi:hypothetical protein